MQIGAGPRRARPTRGETVPCKQGTQNSASQTRIAETGVGAGLISGCLTVQEVFKDLVDGSHSLARKLV